MSNYFYSVTPHRCKLQVEVAINIFAIIPAPYMYADRISIYADKLLTLNHLMLDDKKTEINMLEIDPAHVYLETSFHFGAVYALYLPVCVNLEPNELNYERLLSGLQRFRKTAS